MTLNWTRNKNFFHKIGKKKYVSVNSTLFLLYCSTYNYPMLSFTKKKYKPRSICIMSTRCFLLDKIFYADYGTNESWYVLSLFHEVNHNWKDFAGCYEWFITTSLLLWDKLTWHGTIKRKTAVTGLGNGKKNHTWRLSWVRGPASILLPIRMGLWARSF